MQESKNYRTLSIGDIQKVGRATLHDDLALTGSEVSLNTLPAGVSVPFVHAHQQNEEVYVVLQGKGLFYIDGEEFSVQEGSVVRVDPSGARTLKADDKTSLSYLCIQTRAGSLSQFTQNDGVPAEGKPSWM